MKEIIPVIGYEKLYMVSDDGIVFRVTEKGLKAMKPAEDKDGYFRLTLCKNNKKSTVSIHRLVAEAFIPNPENHPSVNHKDENKQNNSVDNLEWCSVGYNNNYNGLAKRKGIKRQVPIMAVGKGKILYFESITEASKSLNLSHGNISSCLTGRRKTAGGMTFCYQKG